MNLVEIGKKYGLTILDDETIKDLEKDLELSKDVLQKFLVRLNELSELIQDYKEMFRIAKSYSERIEKLNKVINEVKG